MHESRAPRRRNLAALLFALASLLLSALVVAQEAGHDHAHGQFVAGEEMQSFVPGAARLEGRIMAPCCWLQTIDIHGSPMAYELRHEIRRRLKAGESADTIEASLVQRFGPKILAVPNSSPLGGVATVLAMGFGVAGVAAFFMLRRWSGSKKLQAGGGPGKGGDAEPSAKNELDRRLDRELSEIAE